MTNTASNARNASNAFAQEVAEKQARQATKALPEIQKLAYSTAPLVAALAEHKKTQAARQRLWDTAESNEDVHAAQQADLDALNKVRDAFYEVTKDRNGRDHCQLVDLGSMQALAARYSPE